MFDNLFTLVVSLVLFTSLAISGDVGIPEKAAFEAPLADTSTPYSSSQVFTQSASVGLIP